MSTTSFSSLASLTSLGSTQALTPMIRNSSSSLTPSTQRILCSEARSRRNVSKYSPKVAVRENLESVGVPTSVPVRVALELLQAGHRYLDVRTPEEFSTGHAPGAVNIPYMYRVSTGMTRNPHFLAEVSSHFRRDDEIIVGCQSGKRSMMAATDLLAAGYYCITDIAGGHATWTQNSLPLEF